MWVLSLLREMGCTFHLLSSMWPLCKEAPVSLPRRTLGSRAKSAPAESLDRWVRSSSLTWPQLSQVKIKTPLSQALESWVKKWLLCQVSMFCSGLLCSKRDTHYVTWWTPGQYQHLQLSQTFVDPQVSMSYSVTPLYWIFQSWRAYVHFFIF